MGFENELGIGLAAKLLPLKLLATTGAIRAGAKGGVLTPSVTLGALVGLVLGGLWNLAWPGIPPGALAIVGAAAFLASSMKMPVTAIALVVEFTRVNHDFLVPMFFAVAGSIGVFQITRPADRGAR